MFDPKSRYFNIEKSEITIKKDRKNKQRTIRYVKRRFIPNDPSKYQIISEIQVNKNDRIDNISAQLLGDPGFFWQICDLNNVSHPLEITDDPNNEINTIKIGISIS